MAVQGEAGEAAREPCVLINVFEVAEGQEEELIARWKQVAEYMARQDGYISTKFHQSLDPEAKFRFVNVAVWKSPQHYQAVLRTDEFRQFTQGFPAKATPSLYRVVAE